MRPKKAKVGSDLDRSTGTDDRAAAVRSGARRSAVGWESRSLVTPIHPPGTTAQERRHQRPSPHRRHARILMQSSSAERAENPLRNGRDATANQVLPLTAALPGIAITSASKASLSQLVRSSNQLGGDAALTGYRNRTKGATRAPATPLRTEASNPGRPVRCQAHGPVRSPCRQRNDAPGACETAKGIVLARRPSADGSGLRRYAPWQRLNFFPLPQGHGSLRPTPASSSSDRVLNRAAPSVKIDSS